MFFSYRTHKDLPEVTRYFPDSPEFLSELPTVENVNTILGTFRYAPKMLVLNVASGREVDCEDPKGGEPCDWPRWMSAMANAELHERAGQLDEAGEIRSRELAWGWRNNDVSDERMKMLIDNAFALPNAQSAS